jgi:hypothetical protein
MGSRVDYGRLLLEDAIRILDRLTGRQEPQGARGRHRQDPTRRSLLRTAATGPAIGRVK